MRLNLLQNLGLVGLAPALLLSACTDPSELDSSADASATVPSAVPSAPSPTAPESVGTDTEADAGGFFTEAPELTVETPTETEPPAVPEPEYDGPTAASPILACEDAVGNGSDPRIDDFEDGDDLVLAVDQRAGGWYTYTDLTPGSVQLSEWIQTTEPAVTGSGVMHVTGDVFEQYSGVGLVPRWVNAANEHCSFDASHYAGVRFWARGTGSVRVALQNPSVRPVAMGGSCPDAADCYDSHGEYVDLTVAWQPFELPFADALQAGWGLDVGAFNPAELFALEFQFPPGTPYEMWLDDLQFYGEAASTPDAGSDVDAGSNAGSSDASVSDAGDGAAAHAPDASSSPGVADAGVTRDASVSPQDAGDSGTFTPGTN